MLKIDLLTDLYTRRKLSSVQIAATIGCSASKVNYWLSKHQIPKRTIAEAVYSKYHPNGDPFVVPNIDDIEKAMLYGLGIGLYWGEGTKANRYSVRLGNSDPRLLQCFIRFLTELYGVKCDDLRFGLQIFTDIEPSVALNYWMKELSVKEAQFYKIHITKSGSIGTYKTKSKYGVVTVYYHNKRLRDILVGALSQ